MAIDESFIAASAKYDAAIQVALRMPKRDREAAIIAAYESYEAEIQTILSSEAA